jgi:septum formation protein
MGASSGSRLVLASKSPQRQAILGALGVSFVTRPSGFVEAEEGEAAAVALANALGKATAVPREQGETVLAVDTVVSLGGRLWGKPADAKEARATLRALSGETHTVVSGVAVISSDGERRSGTCATLVTFRDLDAATVEWYVEGGEWRERAGGYAIQGAGCALVATIDGDWTNVVGLPVGTLLTMLPRLLAGTVRPGPIGP